MSPASTRHDNPRLSPVAKGYARTKVNATIYQTNALTTHDGTQFVAFYDADAWVTLAKRKLGTDDWLRREDI